MILSKLSGLISTLEMEEEALRNDWTIELLKQPGEGARQQLPGLIIQQVQRKFENKVYEVNGAA